MSVKKAMVIGAGQMGGGIAQVMAAAGIETYLNDINLQIVNSRLEFINKLLDKDIAKGRMDDLQKKETWKLKAIPSVNWMKCASRTAYWLQTHHRCRLLKLQR